MRPSVVVLLLACLKALSFANRSRTLAEAALDVQIRAAIGESQDDPRASCQVCRTTVELVRSGVIYV